MTKRINADLTEVEAVYNDQNNSVTIYDELDHYKIQYYDGIGRLIRVEWYISPTIFLTETYTYNYQDKVVMKQDPSGHVYSCEYDSLGRPIRIYNPDSTFKQVYYDDISNTALAFDENQHKREYHYGRIGNLIWVKEYTDSMNYYLTQYTYDSSGNLTSFTDANGNTTHYKYDSLFGVTQVVYPDFTAETFSYDVAGNLVQRTDASGTTAFAYDSIHHLIEVVLSDQSSVTFQYDLNGNRTLMVDPRGTTSYNCDTRNRLLIETRTIEGEQYTTSYTYDAASRLTSLTYPDQSTVTYGYDSLNRLVSIPGYAEFTYSADSLVESMTYSNGVVTDYQYSDCCNRPTTVHVHKNGTDLLLMNYQYDPGGNVTQLSYGRRSPDHQWAESTESFIYDWLDRLIEVQSDYGSSVYSYDPVGNRLSLNGSTYAYNNMNQLLSISDGTSFGYDENGNTLTRTNGTTTWSYNYDEMNQLTQVKKNQQIVSQYLYDGDGKRTRKTEWIESLQDYQTIVYVYSGLNVIYEKNPDTNQEAAYIYGPTGRVAKKVDGLIDFYHTDYLGSTRLITDESGNVITEVLYTPYGEPIDNEEERYLYTGKEKDISTGLYYYGARYYDPEIGRFITRDPLAGKKTVPQSLNRYIYCLNNPVKLTDPTGLTYRICDVKTGHCIRIDETGSGGWTAYDENNHVITTSDEIQALMASENPADKARAVYLMLLVTHPEIEGDPGQFQVVPSMVDDDATWFDYDVVINGKEETIRVGISTEPFYLGLDPLTGRTKKTYAITWKAIDGGEEIIKMLVFQYAFLSVGRLFHVIGHEGVHVVDYSSGMPMSERQWEQRAWNWNRAHSGIPIFPWTFFPPFTIEPE